MINAQVAGHLRSPRGLQRNFKEQYSNPAVSDTPQQNCAVFEKQISAEAAFAISHSDTLGLEECVRVNNKERMERTFYSIRMSRVTPPDLYEKNSYVTGVQKFIRKVSARSRGRPRISWDGIRKFLYVTPVIRILRMDKFVSNVTPKTAYKLSKMLQY
ncbi:hypothetical protein GGX14DRAFT_399479 [Mycena pura]|uniref:Uncharacterized protein n=1 Tax=Mycena pura TaxID=153505 RepID=A0AAD6Y6R1_9AGAR|nr:hypothetical protein GGX14DRAFT_399479 [Mycena pura]